MSHDNKETQIGKNTTCQHPPIQEKLHASKNRPIFQTGIFWHFVARRPLRTIRILHAQQEVHPKNDYLTEANYFSRIQDVSTANTYHLLPSDIQIISAYAHLGHMLDPRMQQLILAA
ncbi:hypothetical protein Nepgr_027249 [Nepenthes gracilis]|uniref:Uncharacterized protein n=1 Tax=Nepenthes gracilis TaxID=150966 RepID=A0AAD3TA69_NEPGR|nr:hypothetical protein Nepgr_027249 [Nepenthes gracilis]